MSELEKLLETCGCRNLTDLWNYIDYLEDIRNDYEFLKDSIKHFTNTTLNELH